MGEVRISAALLAMVVADLGTILWGVRKALGHAVFILPPRKTACDQFLVARQWDIADLTEEILDGLEGLCGQDRVAPLSGSISWRHGPKPMPA